MMMSYIGYRRKARSSRSRAAPATLRGATPLWVAALAATEALALGGDGGQSLERGAR